MIILVKWISYYISFHFRPYGPILWATILVTMVLIPISKHRKFKYNNQDNNQSLSDVSIIPKRIKPKNLESSLLNLTLMILVYVNIIGYYLLWAE